MDSKKYIDFSTFFPFLYPLWDPLGGAFSSKSVRGRSMICYFGAVLGQSGVILDQFVEKCAPGPPGTQIFTISGRFSMYFIVFSMYILMYLFVYIFSETKEAGESHIFYMYILMCLVLYIFRPFQCIFSVLTGLNGFKKNPEGENSAFCYQQRGRP